MQGAARHKKPYISGPTAHSQSNKHVPFTNLSPQTPAEHYWASRALKAEALLSAHEKYHEEVGRVREDEELKRRSDIRNLENRYKEKYNSLEKLVIILISTIILLSTLLVHLTTSRIQQNTSLYTATSSPPFLSSLWGVFGSSNRKESDSNPGGPFNFHLHLPAHFTIPILSPWASVVEHQTNNGTSANFYLILTSILVVILISTVIFVKYNRTQDVGKGQSQQQSLGPSNNILRLLGAVLNPGLPPLAFWHWAWSWGHRTLRLIGLVPR